MRIMYINRYGLKEVCEAVKAVALDGRLILTGHNGDPLTFGFGPGEEAGDALKRLYADGMLDLTESER